jgi:hypothetical protein
MPPVQLVRLIQVCLAETCSKVMIGKSLFGTLLLPNGLNQRYTLLPFLCSFGSEYAIRKVQDNKD